MGEITGEIFTNEILSGIDKTPLASGNNEYNALIRNALSRVFTCENQKFFDLQGDCKLLYFRVLQN